jgi:hypothetical protein
MILQANSEVLKPDYTGNHRLLPEDAKRLIQYPGAALIKTSDARPPVAPSTAAVAIQS